MTDDTRAEIGHAIPMPVLQEIAQLLGYDPLVVQGITIEPTRVYVLVTEDGQRIEYRHTVTPA